VKKDIETNTSFLLLFNIIKTQIGWKRMNKERKIRTRVDKKFWNFRKLELFWEGNLPLLPSAGGKWAWASGLWASSALFFDNSRTILFPSLISLQEWRSQPCKQSNECFKQNYVECKDPYENVEKELWKEEFCVAWDCFDTVNYIHPVNIYIYWLWLVSVCTRSYKVTSYVWSLKPWRIDR
jgi:hypothetical protein